MIVLLSTLILLAIAAKFSKAKVFETVIASFLAAPIAIFPFSYLIPLNQPLYLLFILLCFGGLVAIQRHLHRVADTSSEETSFFDLSTQTFIVFSITFIVVYGFCRLWPDFIAMGERLRDYAILSSIVKSPVIPKEPWFPDYPLNYYVYWYRVGQMFNAVFQIPVWDLYSVLQSFTYSVYLASAFLLMRRLLKFSFFGAIVGVVLIGFASNIEGVISGFKGDDNWWGPSRVIKGAINEFPVWSFLLGDLHPHYVNLPSLAFILVLMTQNIKERISFERGVFVLFISFTLIPLFLYNSNAWEVPLWVGTAGLCALFVIARDWQKYEFRRESIGKLANPKHLLYVIPALYGIVSLFLSSRHIIPANAPFRLVLPPIAYTTLMELLRHWGFPLILITVSNLLLIRKVSFALIATALVSLTFLYQEAGAFIFVLIGLNLLRLFLETSNDEEKPYSYFIAEALGLASLCLILLPELVFVDDSYGGENERMNTIFKIYTYNWFLIHFYAFALTARAWKQITPPPLRIIVQVVALLVFLRFFCHTVGLRRTQYEGGIFPPARGLLSLEREFPGAQAAIEKFQALPDGITLETQGPPYSYTTHVATLAGKLSYIGWINHVQLLNQAYEETGRRAKITDEIYTTDLCSQKLEIAQKEGIKYIVVGPLETKNYKDRVATGFDCLTLLINEGEYKIYSVPVTVHGY